MQIFFYLCFLLTIGIVSIFIYAFFSFSIRLSSVKLFFTRLWIRAEKKGWSDFSKKITKNSRLDASVKKKGTFGFPMKKILPARATADITGRMTSSGQLPASA